MSNLLSKASENYKVAHSLIISGNNLAPSVHCSYYACLQTTIHILLEREKITPDVSGGAASHEYLIAELIKELDKDYVAIKEFNKIRDLKNFRKDSDYTAQLITLPTAKKAQEVSLDLKAFFRNKFGIQWI